MDKKLGIYVGVKWDAKTIQFIQALCKSYDIPNPVKEKDVHSTLIYSTGIGKIKTGKTSHGARPYKFHHFNTQSGKRACVLLIKSDSLVTRHEQIMKADKNLTYDFPRYIPHITLSYDSGNHEYKDEFKFETNIFLGKEYQEDLKDMNYE